jgi:hypothetical protein
MGDSRNDVFFVYTPWILQQPRIPRGVETRFDNLIRDIFTKLGFELHLRLTPNLDANYELVYAISNLDDNCKCIMSVSRRWGDSTEISLILTDHTDDSDQIVSEYMGDIYIRDYHSTKDMDIQNAVESISSWVISTLLRWNKKNKTKKQY